MASIVERVQSGITITVPPPQPEDGIINYLSQVGQIGLIVVVAIAAGAMSFDSRGGISTFLRSRANGMWELVAPRFTVNAAGRRPRQHPRIAGRVVRDCVTPRVAARRRDARRSAVRVGVPVFVVAVVAASASFTRGTLGTVGIALAVLIALSIVGTIGAVHDWLPSTLSGATVELLSTTQLADYTASLLTAIAAAALLVWLSVARLGRREI